jgi:predicted O-methyltransferase YrrM
MAIGYTTTHLARAVGEKGLVVTIDPSDAMITAAEGYLERAGVRERVRIERGKALDVIPHLRETFDLIFIDAVKEEYTDYLKLSLPRLRSGGVVIVDNLLWGGQVAGEIRSLDQESSTAARVQQLLRKSSQTVGRSTFRWRRLGLRRKSRRRRFASRPRQAIGFHSAFP